MVSCGMVGEQTREVIGDRREEEKSEERRRREQRYGCPGITGTIPGVRNTMAGSRGGRRDFGPPGWMDSGLPPMQVGRRDTAGLSTPAPCKRNQRLLDTRDSGIGTGETRGPGLTGASGIQEARRMAGREGVVASTPMTSEGLNWTCGVNRYSPIMEGQPWLSPPLGVKDAWDGREVRTGVMETVNPPDRPNLGMSVVPASRRPGRFTNTAVARFDV